jgi:hypothetical protein
MLSRVRRLYKTGFGLTTGFIGSHTVTLLQPSFLQLQLTLTTESVQGPGPPADPTGSHWPSNNSLYSEDCFFFATLQLLGWNTNT